LKSGVEAINSCISGMVDGTVLVKEITITSFQKIEGYKITINNQTAFFPKSLEAIKFNVSLDRLRVAFLDVDLVIPPYFQVVYLNNFVAALDKCTDIKEREMVANVYLLNMYTEDSIASFCTEVYKKKKVIAPYYDCIIESIKAYCLGLYKSAIISLIPCVEGIIRNIGKQIGLGVSDMISKESFLNILEKVQLRDIQDIFKGYDWLPVEEINIELFDKFHERIQMIESVKFFIKNSMYQHTKIYLKLTQLNRHGIIHGLITDFDNATNYLRLINLVNSLSVVSIIAGDPGSSFHPEFTEEAQRLSWCFQKYKQLNFQIDSNIQQELAV